MNMGAGPFAFFADETDPDVGSKPGDLFPGNKLRQLVLRIMYIAKANFKYIVQLLGCSLKILRPPALHIIDGLEYFFSALVYKQGSVEMLLLHKGILFVVFIVVPFY